MPDPTRAPSLWPPGDEHYTYADMVRDSPTGALPMDPHSMAMADKDAQIAALREELASTGHEAD